MPARTGESRLQFLDALRGFAAMAVLFQHGAERLWPDYLHWSETVFRPGEFGVVVFFLVSGFIIPGSIERYGSLARFWVGRFFRLFPMYWVAIVAALCLKYGWGRYYMNIHGDVGRGIAVNLTMVQQFLHTPSFIGSTWTLAYEMTFYALASVLFLAGLHRRPVPVAATWLAAALVAGSAIPPLVLVHPKGGVISDVIVVTVVVAAIVAVCTRRVGRAAVAVALVAVVLPLTLNRPDPLWFSTLLFSTMFVGSVVAGWMRGTVPAATAIVVYLAGMATVVAVTHANIEPHPIGISPGVVGWATEAWTFVGAYLVFGIAVLARNVRVPKAAVWLGLISYSLYLTHPLVYAAIIPARGHREWTLARWLVVTIAVSAVTYRGIERPFHDLGRRLARGRPRPAPPAPAPPTPPTELAEHAAP